jgi:DNA sulfur modification protein DndB
MTSGFTYTFSAIRGVQAKREYYVSMCPLRLIPKIFSFEDIDMPPEMRAQRVVNHSRLPEITGYIVENPTNYTFSAITASIDGDISFEPVGTGLDQFRMGTLSISMDARFIVNDGQHRREAIRNALEQVPELGDETIAVVFFQDRGLERSQQMFADLNRHAVKPSPSMNILYDHRDARASLARHLALTSSRFKGIVELEKTTLSERSRKLFTLSALEGAIRELFTAQELDDLDSAKIKCVQYWELMSEFFGQWAVVLEGNVSAGEVRKNYIHCHAVTLQALGRVGRQLYASNPKMLRSELQKLKEIDWSRSNQKLWDGRAMLGNRMEKSNLSVTLTANRIKQTMGLSLTPEEKEAERVLKQSRIDRLRG